MKVTIDIECTPEEARTFLGLPDLAPVHEAYVAQLIELAKNGVSKEMVEGMIKGWAPMGEAGMKLWSGLVEGLSGAKR